MRKIILSALLGFLAATMLFAGSGRAPVNQPVEAQAGGVRVNWISNERAAANTLIAAAQQIVALDQEYVANGYSGTLTAPGDFTGANAGLVVADMTTAEGNMLTIAQGILGIGSFPKSIASGTNSTIFRIR